LSTDGEHPLSIDDQLGCPPDGFRDTPEDVVSFRTRLTSASRWIIPLAGATFAVCLASMASAKGQPQKKHAGATHTQTSHTSARPKTTKPAVAGHGTHGTTKPGAHARRRGSAHGHSETPEEARVAAYQAQEHVIHEGDLPPVVEGAACRGDMALVDSRFCIDKWEGALVQVLAAGEERPWSPYDVVPEGVKVRATTAPGVYPQAYISGAMAQFACAASGKRLCHPIEWRTACMGPRKQLFGYGNQRETGRCNDHGRAPMGHFYPQVAVSWTLVGMTEMNDPQLNQWEGTLMRTGESAECTNEYGVFDMVGNLHEWTDDPNGTFQGGYYLDTHQNGDGCGYRTTAHEFTYHDYSTGFRCCADATSATAGTSTLGAASAAGSGTTTTGAPTSTSTAPPAPTNEPMPISTEQVVPPPPATGTVDPYESTVPQQ
jgi:hypothetical protein